MKFYEIPTSSGPQFVSTQAEAKAAGVKNPQPIEVNTTEKEAIRVYLNELKAAAFAARQAQSTFINEPSDEPAIIKPPVESLARRLVEQIDNPPKPRQASKLFEHDDIVEIIVDSTGFQLSNYFAAVMEAAGRVQRNVVSS